MKRLLIRALISSTICVCCIMGVKCEESLAGIRVLSWNLVDSGKHLDWDGKTKYSSHFNSAIKVWNNYKKGVIRKDNVFRIEDVAISDYYEISNTAGLTCNRGTIMFNRYVMDRFNGKGKKNVCIHELGHALGLAHNTKKDIMYQYATTRGALSTNDKKSFNYVYKYKY